MIASLLSRSSSANFEARWALSARPFNLATSMRWRGQIAGNAKRHKPELRRLRFIRVPEVLAMGAYAPILPSRQMV
jgi:hypothetical protein